MQVLEPMLVMDMFQFVDIGLCSLLVAAIERRKRREDHQIVAVLFTYIHSRG